MPSDANARVCSYNPASLTPGPCRTPANEHGKYCQNHACPCGQAKRSQWNTCGQCPASPTYKCGHPNCDERIVASSQAGRCAMHACPWCGQDKKSTYLACSACRESPQQRKCRHIGSGNRHCLEYPTGNTRFCAIHTCPVCGQEKSGSMRRCVKCPALCGSCGGEMGPKDDICGNCQSGDAGCRNAYISTVRSTLQKQRKTWLFIWDFDQTITRSHASDKTPPIPESSIAHDLVDGDFFREVIKHLHGHGHFVKIASWADGPRGRHVLTDYMTFLFGPNEKRHFLRDEGLEAFIPHAHGMENEGKNMHIRNLLRQVNAQSLRVEVCHVVLFDDNEFNCIKAREAGHRSVTCPRGFNREAWSAFIDSFGDNKPAFHSDALVSRSQPRPRGGEIQSTPSTQFQQLSVNQPVHHLLSPRASLSSTSSGPKPLRSPRAPISPTSSGPKPDVIRSYYLDGKWIPTSASASPSSSPGVTLTSLPGSSVTSLPGSSVTSLLGSSIASTLTSPTLP